MLKEQDDLIEWIREWIIHPEEMGGACHHLTVVEVFEIIEEMIREEVERPQNPANKLRKYLPKIETCHLALDMKRALQIYDKKTHLLSRKFVPPTFKEIRHVLNIAVINAIAPRIKLVTFDADDTIYEDGGIIHKDSKMAEIIVELLKRGLVVSLVTAAGYPGQPERYEQRLQGILESLSTLPDEMTSRFLVMGGECNYLHKTRRNDDTGEVGLAVVEPKEWKDGRGVRWSEDDITDLLDKAEKTLKDTVELLHLPAKVLRKERACGIINTSSKRFSYENLEEIALTVQKALRACKVPHCAFNGGNDVWVDAGNKALGISALQKFVPRLAFAEKEIKVTAAECLHVGDRFTKTGNDTKSREVSSTAWVSDPEETVYIMKKLIERLDARE